MAFYNTRLKLSFHFRLRRNETINAKMRDERIKAQIEEAVARVMPPPPPKPVSRIVFDVSPESVSHPKGQLSVRVSLIDHFEIFNFSVFKKSGLY